MTHTACGNAIPTPHRKFRVFLEFAWLFLYYWGVDSTRGGECETVVLGIHVSRGIQVKNRAYSGPQGEVVLAAWVNLEAGL